MIRTKQRQLILNAVMASTAHPTADELFQQIRGQLPTISLATVYRNLNLLSADGVIRKIEMPGMPARFDHTMETIIYGANRVGGCLIFPCRRRSISRLKRSPG